jgi:multidrug transporter EmrE-like cation transporter
MVGLVMYGEEVNKIQVIGMVVGLVAIGLISWGSEM